MSIFLGLDESGADNSEIHFSEISVREIDDTTLPTDLYKIETLIRRATSGSGNYHECSELSEVEARRRDQAPLSRPTLTRPVFYRNSATTIQILPTSGYTSSNRFVLHYIKKPARVAWGYIVTSGTSVYNSGTSTNFDFHESEEVNLVNRILVLAGIMMKDPSLYQVIAQEEVKDIQQEKA